jgi:hypothetical protein
MKIIVKAFVCIGFLSSRTDASESPPRIKKIEESTVWPVGTRFLRLGIQSALPDFAWVEAPVNVIEAAKKILVGAPETWEIQKIKNLAGQRKNVVLFRDNRNHYLICLMEDRRWIRLNENCGAPTISNILIRYLGSKADLANVNRVAEFVEYFALLYKGPQRIVLSERFLTEAESNWAPWLAGKDSNPVHLRKLCAAPSIKQHGADIQIVCNIISDQGVVEKWTLKGSRSKGIHISDASIEVLRGKGSFSYGRVGG